MGEGERGRHGHREEVEMRIQKHTDLEVYKKAFDAAM